MEFLQRHSFIGIVIVGIAAGFFALKFSNDYANRQQQADTSSSTSSQAADAVIISGFRSAMFGMNEDDVRAAIAKDFTGDVKIAKAESPAEKTTLLAIRAKDVIPDSGVAEIVYILGYQSKTLIQVNILWGTQVTPEVTPVQLRTTAALLQKYFMERGFVPGSIMHDKALPTGAIVVFSGADAQGRLIRLMYQEVDAASAESTQTKSDKPQSGAKEAVPTKLVALRLSYIEDEKDPDIFKIKKGQF